MNNLDSFTRQYIETALWSSTDDDGMHFDRDFSICDIAPDALATMIADCAKFQAENADTMNLDGCQDASMCGHDFWLTRNGHGAGFWDGDYPEEIGDALTAASKQYRECSLYVGDDGLIYL